MTVVATAPVVETAKAPELKSSAFMRSLAAAKDARAAQITQKQREEGYASAQKELADAKAFRSSIEAARAAGDIPELHRLLGVSPEATTTWLKTATAPNPGAVVQELAGRLQTTDERLKAFEAEQKKAREAATQTERQSAAQELITEIHSAVEQYPVVATLGYGQMVVDLITRTHEQTGELLDPSKAAQQVEDGLFKELPGYLKKLAAHKKLRPIFEAALKDEAVQKVIEASPTVQAGPQIVKKEETSKAPALPKSRHQTLRDLLLEAEREVEAKVKAGKPLY